MDYVLAPLAGFTNAAFRRLCHTYGAAYTYTEMVSAAGLAHGSSPTRHLMETLPGEGPVVCQIFGAKPDELALAAREATACGRFAGLDLNAGCPMPKIRAEGAGAALLRDPAHVHACLVALRQNTTLPVTLKTRPGPKPDRILLAELLAAAQDAGCAGMTLHARFTSQMHGGPVHLDLLADLVRTARIPITGNGSVADAATAHAMAQTGVAAIMIGRAALSAPWLFADLRGGASCAPPAADRQVRAFRAHLAALEELYVQLAARFPHDRLPSRDAYLLTIARTHLFRYFAGRPGAAEFRRQLNTARTYDAFRAHVAALVREADA